MFMQLVLVRDLYFQFYQHQSVIISVCACICFYCGMNSLMISRLLLHLQAHGLILVTAAEEKREKI